MVVTRSGFTQVAANAFAGLGFPPEGPSVYEFPMEMFIAGSDLTPINENIDKIVYGLTKWQPKVTTKGVLAPPKVTATGKDYQEAVTNMNFLFLKNLWSDGLPILPATEERVNWILSGTDLPRDTVVGKILPRGGIASVESVAVGLAMAGGRPEYLPVLIAAAEAIDHTLGPKGYGSWAATTASTIPVVIVNGPVAKQIRLNSGYGCLGPDPQRPAGGCIGRAIRLIMLGLGGAIPGIGTMAIFGTARHTNVVFAEDEDGLPKGWEPLSVERGFPKGTNVVTWLTVTDLVNTLGMGTLFTGLSQTAAMMAGPARNRVYDDPTESPGVVLLARGTAQAAADEGWSKLDTIKWLWEKSKTPWELIELTGKKWDPVKAPWLVKGQPWPITKDPEKIMLVVAGGEQSGHNFLLWNCSEAKRIVSKGIKLPAKAKWDALLKQAEKDLGPIPAA